MVQRYDLVLCVESLVCFGGLVFLGWYDTRGDCHESFSACLQVLNINRINWLVELIWVSCIRQASSKQTTVEIPSRKSVSIEAGQSSSACYPSSKRWTGVVITTPPLTPSRPSSSLPRIRTSLFSLDHGLGSPAGTNWLPRHTAGANGRVVTITMVVAVIVVPAETIRRSTPADLPRECGMRELWVGKVKWHAPVEGNMVDAPVPDGCICHPVR